MAQAVQDLFPDAKLGIGPPIENGFYYDFDVETPFVPEDLEKIETRMRKIIKEGQRFSRRVTTDADAIDELKDEPYKIELIGLKGARQGRGRRRGRERRGRRRRAHHLRQHPPQRRGRLERPVPRPAPADHQADPGVQADAVRGGVLARRREEQAAAADLRHRLGVQGGARGAPAPDRGGRAPRPPQARPRARPVQLPRRARLRPGGLPPQGRRDQAGDGGLRPPRHIEEGFEYVGTPHISKEGLFHTSGHLPYYADGMFPPMEMEGANYYLKAMNCPMHNLIFRSRGRSYRELPLRLFEFGSRLPLREVRRRARPDPGARADPGRLALLRHPRAGAGRDQAPARLLPRPVPRLRARRLLPRAVHPRRRQARQVRRHDERVGGGHPGARGRRHRLRARAGARPGRRGVLRPEDLGAGPRRDRPDLADVDDPVRLQPAARLRAGVPGRRRHPAAAGDDPLGEVRLDRAVHRRARRALRRRVPAVAGAGAGAGDPDRRAARRLPVRRRAADDRPPGCGSRSTTPTTGCRRRSATRSCRRCRS